MAARGDYLMVAALDFGTTFCGYAFSMRDSPETIITNNNWGASLGFKSHKTPTSVLTDDKGNFVDMGFTAEHTYADSLVERSQTLHLYRHFKMILHKSKDVKINSTIVSLDGTISPALDIFGYAINYLRNHLLKALEKSLERVPTPDEIFWVITVPAIWSEPSKKFMREAALRGGCITDLNDKNLLLALEPEAASLCCRRLQIAQYDEKYSFPEGTTYLVLDCGGGTVDVTAHMVLEGEKVEEVLPASGGPWGGMYVDKNFETLLVSIFGADFMNKFKQNHPDAWLDLMSTFETVKKSFTDDSECRLRIKLPFCFTEGDKISTVRARIEEFGDTNIFFLNGILVLGHDAVKNMFTQVNDEVIRHVTSMLKQPKLKEMKYIFMVGGFSECTLLQTAIKEAFEKNGTKVLVPHDCQLGVIKGAVLFGHYPLEITSRISKFTFGKSTRKKFDKKIHKEAYRYVDEQGREICKHVFLPIVYSGERIKAGQEKNLTSYSYTNRATKTTTKLYLLQGLPQEPVMYTNEPGLDFIGQVEVHHPSCLDYHENKMNQTFIFGGTEIHVRVIHEATGKEYSTCLDFLSYPE